MYKLVRMILEVHIPKNDIYDVLVCPKHVFRKKNTRCLSKIQKRLIEPSFYLKLRHLKKKNVNIGFERTIVFVNVFMHVRPIKKI